MATKARIAEDLDFVTSRIGEQTRTIAIGVLALVWLFASAKESVLETRPSQAALLVAASLAILSLLADYAQYIAAYVVSKRTLNHTGFRGGLLA